MREGKFFISAVMFLPAVLFFAACSQPQAAPEIISTEVPSPDVTQIVAPGADAAALVDLGLALEEDFGLREVIVSRDGPLLLVKFKAPTISGEELNEGLVQIFGYLAAQAPAGVDKIRLVFVINHVDSAVVEVSLQQVKDWMEGKTDNAAFISSFKKISLI